MIPIPALAIAAKETDPPIMNQDTLATDSKNKFPEEIKEPLTSIYLAVELLRCYLKDDEKKICVDIIMRNSVRIDTMINKFIDYQRADKVQPA